MTSIGLGEAEKSLDCLLIYHGLAKSSPVIQKHTIGVALDFDNHLLETPDGLITTLLGHLLAQVVPRLLDGSALGLLCVLLVLIWNVSFGLLLEVLNSSGCALTSSLLIIARVTLTGVDALLSSISSLVAVEGLVLVVLVGGLLADVLAGQIRNIMPGVVLGSLVDLAKFLLRWVDFASSLGCAVTSHVTQKDCSIIEKLAELTVGEEKSSESLQTVESLITVLFGGIFVCWCPWDCGIAAIEVLTIPDEVL